MFWHTVGPSYRLGGRGKVSISSSWAGEQEPTVKEEQEELSRIGIDSASIQLNRTNKFTIIKNVHIILEQRGALQSVAIIMFSLV